MKFTAKLFITTQLWLIIKREKRTFVCKKKIVNSAGVDMARWFCLISLNGFPLALHEQGIEWNHHHLADLALYEEIKDVYHDKWILYYVNWTLIPQNQDFLRQKITFFPVMYRDAHCLKITKNVAFDFFNFGIFHQFLSNWNWPVW